jgi:hypothetical protein
MYAGVSTRLLRPLAAGICGRGRWAITMGTAFYKEPFEDYGLLGCEAV